MKAIARVTGIVVVASAAIFALNLGTAMAAPPPPFEHELLPLQEIDSCILLGTCEEEPPLLNICATSPWLCEPLAPIDPCMLLGNCDDEPACRDTYYCQPRQPAHGRRQRQPGRRYRQRRGTARRPQLRQHGDGLDNHSRLAEEDTERPVESTQSQAQRGRPSEEGRPQPIRFLSAIIAGLPAPTPLLR